MSPMYESYPFAITFAASLGICLTFLSIGYYLKLFLHLIWNAGDEMDTLSGNCDRIVGSGGYQSIEDNYGKSPEKISLIERGASGRIGAYNGIAFKQDHLAATTKSDAELVVTLSKMLASGIMITLHSTKGPRSVRFYLLGDELKWESTNASVSSKRYRLKLSEILSIYSGKNTTNLRAVETAEDSCCFSLVTQGTSLDLETTCELDRNCLVRGLTLKMETTNRSSQNE